jgi:5-methylcytosine-specific restriction protein A
MTVLKPKQICKYVGCQKTIDDYGYCEKHQGKAKKPRGKFTDMYNYQWKKVRAVFLKENPLCLSCMKKGSITPATIVDHIKPHKGDTDLFWDQDNYQPLCKPCHDVKTATEDGGFGNTIKGNK